TNVTATYGEGSPQSIGSEDWCLSRREPAQFSLDIPSQVGGETLSELVVTFTAGETSASDIPADLIRALYLLTAHYYEQREAFQEQRYVAVPLTVEALLNSYREIRL
ncbi:MAG: head-tail connector protein, partial [Pseudomonadota bacterium]